MINFNKKDSVAEEVAKILAQEAELSHKQKRIAALAGDKKAIDALDLAALRAGKKPVDVEEGFGEMDKYLKDKEKEKGTGKYDKKKISTGTVYQKKHNAPKEDEKDDMKEEVEQIDEISKETAGKYLTAPQGKGANKYKTGEGKSSYPNADTMLKHGKSVSRAVQRAGTGMSKKPSYYKEEEEQIDETVSRKHFQQVADLIKSHENAEKRKELAQHHASIFKTQNPRFDHAKFMKAAGVNEGTWAEEADCVTTPQAKKIAKKEVHGHEKKMHHEEVEELDELKKSTVSSYVQKKFAKMNANPSSSTIKTDAKGIQRAASRMSGIKATQKEEVEIKEGRKPEKDDHEPHPIHGDIGLTKGDVRDTAYKEGLSHAAGNKHGSNAKAWGPEAKHYSAGFMAGRNDADRWHKNMSKITRTEEVELDERTLTAAETKKKEHMVMSMKPKLKDFKKRYGERAKEVLYATATKRAKGE